MRRPLLLLLCSLPLLALALALAPIASADTNYQPLPFAQDWSNTGLLVTTDAWGSVPGILGLGGMGMSVTSGVDPQTLLTSDGGSGRVTPNLTDPLGATIEGVGEFHLTDPVVALAPASSGGGGGGGGQLRAPHLILHLDASGRHTIVVSYRLRDLEGPGGTDNAIQQFALQYRVGGSGLWTNVPAGYVADATDGPGLTKETLVSATLPPAANFATQLQVRIITANAVGNDEWVGVDDISVTGTPSQFEDVTPAILAGGGAFRGAAWGYPIGTPSASRAPALFVSCEGTANRLFRYYLGVWSVDSSSALGLVGNGAGAVMTARGEADRQGIYLPTSAGLRVVSVIQDFPWNAPTFLLSTTIVPTTVVCQAWADFDQDGNADLFVADSTGACTLYRADFYGALTAAPAPGLPAVGDVRGAEWGDFDGDGDPDLLLARFDRPSVVVRNLGGGAFDSVGFGAAATDLAIGATWADFDEDGDLDAFLTRDGVACRLMRNDGSAWADVTPSPLSAVSAWRGAGWSDFDHDGDLDLYVVRLGGTDVFMRNDGASWTDIAPTEGAMAAATNGIAVAWSDYDLDGVPDLYVTRQGAPASLYRNVLPAANHYFRVLPYGRHTNRSATGMRVRIVVGGVSHSRTISGGSGYRSQNEPIADFGLGSATVVDSVIVHWPLGPSSAFVPLAGVDRTLVVTETPRYFVASTAVNAYASFGASIRQRDALTSDVPNMVIDGRQFYFAGNLQEEVHYNEFLSRGSHLWGQVDDGNDSRWGLLVTPTPTSSTSAPQYWGAYSELGSSNVPHLADSSTAPWYSAGAFPNAGASWVDIDGDGDLDAHVMRGTGHPGGVVLRRDPGTWTEATPPLLAVADSAHHAAWADFDADRDPDVLIVGSGKRHQLIRNDGAGWTDVTPPALLAAPVAEFGWDASFADYDDDGDLDLLLFDSNGAHLYRHDGATWTDTNNPTLAALGDSFIGATWSDLDLDGDLDLFVGSLTPGAG
ncbi:MAG: VCBS repeat-containing protein, partial [Candidatus Eisenbacteria bacterium]|nr:VCBS repeat-containing protein [Candidatus Eisenbacteria bacterium]